MFCARKKQCPGKSREILRTNKRVLHRFILRSSFNVFQLKGFLTINLFNFLTFVFSICITELQPQADFISQYQIFAYQIMQNLQKEILHNDSEKDLMLASKSKEQVHTFFQILKLFKEIGKQKWIQRVGARASLQTAQGRFQFTLNKTNDKPNPNPKRQLHHKTSNRAVLNTTLGLVPLINGGKLHIVLLTRKCLNDSVPSYPKITIFILMPLYKRFRQDAVMTFVFRNSNQRLPGDLFILLMRWNLMVFLAILNQRNRPLYCIFTDAI